MRIPIINGVLFSIILLSLAFLLLNSAPDESVTHKPVVRDGLLYVAGTDDIYSGVVKDTVGDRLLEYEVVNGLKQGSFTAYFMNGKVAFTGKIIDNKNVGKWLYFYPNGKIESIGYFNEDKIDGYWKWFYDDGKIKEEGSYKNGERDGRWIQYNREGAVKSVVTFYKGEEINKVEQYFYLST